MASQMKSLMADGSRYLKAFQLFEERSSMSQLMQDLIRNELPATLASIGNGKSHLNVIGVGSGSGELDLEVISELHLKHPDATMDCEVVEPDFQQLHSYKALVSQTPGLDYIKFNWNNMTANEFEDGWKEKKMTKKADIILVFQMLYYVKDPEATVSFFRSLLNKNGKLLISLVSDTSGCKKMWQTYMSQLTYKRINHLVTSGDVKNFLDSKGVSCQSYELQSHADISECFTEGDEKGELLLDFVTTLLHFSKAAPPELKAGIMELLHHRDCSVVVDGKVMFNNNAEVIVIDQLT